MKLVALFDGGKTKLAELCRLLNEKGTHGSDFNKFINQNGLRRLEGWHMIAASENEKIVGYTTHKGREKFKIIPLEKLPMYNRNSAYMTPFWEVYDVFRYIKHTKDVKTWKSNYRNTTLHLNENLGVIVEINTHTQSKRITIYEGDAFAEKYNDTSFNQKRRIYQSAGSYSENPEYFTPSSYDECRAHKWCFASSLKDYKIEVFSEKD